MKKHKVALGTASVALVGLLGLGLAIQSGRSEAASGASRAEGQKVDRRVGERIEHYLGLDVPPSVWAARLRERDATARECVAAKGMDVSGLPPQAAYSKADELHVADPVEYARLFGYGVVERMRPDVVANENPQSNGALPSDAELAIASNCVRLADEFMSKYTAPMQVHQRYAAILQQTATDSEYTAGVERWSKCLTGHGIVATNPFSISNLVADEAFRLAGPAASNNIDPDMPWPLTPRQMDELQAFELSLYAVDDECRNSTGLRTAMLVLEDRILAQLMAEFPDFNGAGT